jgi:uncharacterized membrane protein YkoI
MKRPIVLSIAAAALLAGSAGAAGAHAVALKGHEFAAQTKITLLQARALALKARPGRIVDQELEKEGGGSGLRYSFDVVSHGKTIEVGIDAVTGKVLENGSESAASEAQEAAREKASPKP